MNWSACQFEDAKLIIMFGETGHGGVKKQDTVGRKKRETYK